MKKVALIGLFLALASVLPALAQTPQPTPHYINLTWVKSTSTGLSGYHVMRADIACPATGLPTGLTQIAAVGDVNTYDDHTALAGQPYCYTVRAFNSLDESADSNTSQAVIPFPPQAPTGTAATLKK